jgi:hypothetical protein
VDSIRPGFVTLADLVEAVGRRQRLDRDIDDLVAALVARGVGRADIGRALGISRQGARQRYGGR